MIGLRDNTEQQPQQLNRLRTKSCIASLVLLYSNKRKRRKGREKEKRNFSQLDFERAHFLYRCQKVLDLKKSKYILRVSSQQQQYCSSTFLHACSLIETHGCFQVVSWPTMPRAVPVVSFFSRRKKVCALKFPSQIEVIMSHPLEV